MKQRQLSSREDFDLVEAPATEHSQMVPHPAPAAPDLPKAAGVFMVAAYAALMGAFAVTIHGSRSGFAITIAAFYLLMFFAIPAVFLRLANDTARRPDLVQFLDRGIDTATGRIGGGGALVQMLIVPVLLAFAVFAMGVTYLLV
jgi:hypothetical protein